VSGKSIVEALAAEVVKGNRGAIGRAITLVESTRADHRAQAQKLLTLLLPRTGQARRVGITGVPGVGKSTLINALGSRLTAAGHRVAVLAVDPSSSRTGGSILGDKTRMPELATDDNAFIRPSPASGQLGGVARATRESILVMEAAGYDIVIVETVGIGQSETLVAEMTDTFVLLALARTGDQLQGIKKGVLELADVVAVNKADGAHELESKRTARELAGALRLIIQPDGAWRVPVLTCSAETGAGLPELWTAVDEHEAELRASGQLEHRRGEQQVVWTWDTVRDRLLDRMRASSDVRALVPKIEDDVRRGALPPSLAADRILAAFLDTGGKVPGGTDPGGTVRRHR
jgi:LAO/AO transport system kinase